MLTTGKNHANPASRASAFTLVELILVMAILIVVVSLIIPRLSVFFGTRSLNSEVSRFLALTHYAQSRAVGEGVPMMVWLDPRTGTYGLKQEAGYSDNDPKAVDYTVADGLTLDTLKQGAPRTAPVSQTGRILSGQARAVGNATVGIHFLPDGSINSATSVAGVDFQHLKDQPVWIGMTTNRLGYEVQEKTTILANARRY